MSAELQKLESWRKDLALVETFDELKLIGDAAKAYQQMQQRQRVAKSKQDEVGEFIVEVEEQMGGWLDEHYPHVGGRNFKLPQKQLEKMPATYQQSARSRRLNEIRNEMPDFYEQKKAEIKESEKVLTPASLDSAIKKDLHPHVLNNSGENEWYTPPEYIESARKVMGDIDLDPASSDMANKIIKAPVFYTKESNGLDKKWNGNVWLNPPYAQPLISQFAKAIIEKREQYDQAIILVNNATETNWLQSLMNISDAVCFPRGRVRFLDINGNPGAPLQGQIILYIGIAKTVFTVEFKKYGTCMVKA